MSHILTPDKLVDNPVTTAHGVFPESDLDIKLSQADDGASFIMSRVYVYKGSARPDLYGHVVRQDAWVTMKCGIKSGVKSGV